MSDIVYDLKRRLDPRVESYWNRHNVKINKQRQNAAIKKWLKARLSSKAALLAYGFVIGFAIEWWFVF